ncbi:MAG: MarR family winged helix-turn-helix transcriptional regulator [Sphingopyxis sp.]
MTTRNIAPGLGTLLRRLQELTDGALERLYVEADLDYVPRYTPVVRALADAGAHTVRDVAGVSGVSHSAASQTVSRMLAAGLVSVSVGKDARERYVQLTQKTLHMLPQLRLMWAATERAALLLEQEIGQSLHATLSHAIAALEAQSFDSRIVAASPQLIPAAD